MKIKYNKINNEENHKRNSNFAHKEQKKRKKERNKKARYNGIGKLMRRQNIVLDIKLDINESLHIQ